VALGPLGEDVEDQARAVDHVAAERFFQVALLHRRQRVIENRERRLLLLEDPPDLLDLAGTREVRGIGPVAPASHDRADAEPGARR
jgi:hypothetical protein